MQNFARFANFADPNPRGADAEVERGLLGRRQREELPAEAQFRELLSVDHKSAFEIRFRMAQHGALFP